VTTALAINVGTSGAFITNGGALGTPSSGTLTSCTGLPISTGVSGLGTNVATFLATPTSANLAVLGDVVPMPTSPVPAIVMRRVSFVPKKIGLDPPHVKIMPSMLLESMRIRMYRAKVKLSHVVVFPLPKTCNANPFDPPTPFAAEM